MTDPIPVPQSRDFGEFLIRRYFPGDGQALYEATEASRDHLYRWMPWAREKGSVAQSEAVVERLVQSFEKGEDYTLGVWMGTRLVGGTGFHLRVGGPHTLNAEIGMWIHGEFASHGLGTRVLNAMLDWGFEDWGWERLVWKCDTENFASARVAEKAGMLLEGTFRKDFVNTDGTRSDTFQFAILKEDWNQIRLS